MSFELVDRWDARQHKLLMAPRRRSPIFPWPALSARVEAHGRRATSALLSLALIALPLWLLLLANQTPGTGPGKGRTGRQLLSFEGHAEAAQKPEEKQLQHVSPRTETAAAPVPTIAPITPLQWSTSRIPAAAPVSGAAAAAPSGSPGGGRAGGGYDPYAGAAPMPKSEAARQDVRIDPAALEAIKARVRQRYPNMRGAVSLFVSFAAGGRVLHARVDRATLAAEALAALVGMVEGAQLAATAAEGASATVQIEI